MMIKLQRSMLKFINFCLCLVVVLSVTNASEMEEPIRVKRTGDSPVLEPQEHASKRPRLRREEKKEDILPLSGLSIARGNFLATLEIIRQHGDAFQEIDLSHNSISSGELWSLSILLQSYPHITSLDLSHNQLGSDDLEELLKLTSLKKLNLSHNQIGFEGFKKVAMAVSRAEVEKEVDLRGNPLAIEENRTAWQLFLQQGYKLDFIIYDVPESSQVVEDLSSNISRSLAVSEDNPSIRDYVQELRALEQGLVESNPNAHIAAVNLLRLYTEAGEHLKKSFTARQLRNLHTKAGRFIDFSSEGKMAVMKEMSSEYYHQALKHVL